MKRSSPYLIAYLTALVFTFCSAATYAQTSATEQQTSATAPAAGGAAGHEHQNRPAPTNLKVLPKTMTGDEVRDLMHKWEGELGTECSTCHAADPKNIGPNGRPRLNFADDSKPEKNTARLMFRMVEDINKNYVSMVENSGVPVTCGTCHHGHLDPPIYSPPKGEHHDEHAAPAADGVKPPAN